MKEKYYFDMLHPKYNKIRPTDNTFKENSVQEKAQLTLKNIDKYWKKPVIALNNNEKILFDSISKGSDYIILNNLSNGKKKTIEAKITRVCKGERKSAYGYEWKYSKV